MALAHGLEFDSMQFIGSFTTFNPINGYFVTPYSELGKSSIGTGKNAMPFPLMLDWIAGRAQRIIMGRQLPEIEYALSTINYLIDKAIVENVPAIDSDEPIEIAAGINIHAIPKELNTPARLLNSQLSNISLENDDSFPNAKWEEYFAVLALAALGDIHRFYQIDNEIDGATIGLAAEAMEALTFAESPTAIEPLLSKSEKTKTSIRNSENARKGHASLNKWKDRFRTWVLENYAPGTDDEPFVKRNAAKRFIGEVLNPQIAAGADPEFKRPQDLSRVLADSLASDPRFKDF